ncbi:amidohydrolase [Falsihalocynthiibacter sp. SS001]|uniref:amidohydrolase n=1 Tax=Falsihalocynthiibacter sp. SS001 TaxID=3349698 RepID=UPI0036D3DE67
MKQFSRRSLIRMGLLGATSLCSSGLAVWAQSASLGDIGTAISVTDKVTVYSAREIVTLDPNKPAANAVATVNGRILAVGSLSEIETLIGDQPYEVDLTFEDNVIVPGFIAEHDHPMLAALTMSSKILAIEDWVLPDGTVPAVKDKADFMARMIEAEGELDSPDEPLLTWGYHTYFFGELTRTELDTISATRPIFVWARSCHEFTLNTAAMQAAGVTEDAFNSWADPARKQSNFEAGHFWEQGLFALLPYIAEMVANPANFKAGLELMRDYMHAKGITYGNEPGGILAKPVQDMVNSVLSSPSMPFRWSFIPDGKSLIALYEDDEEVIAETKKLASWYGGMTEFVPNQIKLFADGAIYSLAMQVREPYLDGHFGAWMMEKDLFERAFRVYWDAGYQIHIHVNGDAGLDRVLDSLEVNQRRNPRFDHRTTIVHFAVSAPEQVARIKQLGAIVSANPYYVTALADKYSEVGLGPKRADQMVRLGDLESAGISYSLHSDMPMAPSDPLFLMWCAVNRVTSSGRVADAEQSASPEAALRAVTLEAAFALRQEHMRGSIEAGKLANFTILDDNPLTVDTMAIKEIGVWGTVMEGRKFKAGSAKQEDASLQIPSSTLMTTEFAQAAIKHVFKSIHSHG